MNILAHCYTYGNNSCSGADKMLQSLLEYLAVREANCRVVIDFCPQPYTLNKVQVLSSKHMLAEQYDWCDVVIIHLVAKHEAKGLAQRFNKPVVTICHNAHVKIDYGYVIYNSAWLRDTMQLPCPSIVVHPPTNPIPNEPSHFDRPYVTLVNTNDNKGGTMLRNIATQMPQYKFLGVHGGYDKNQMYQPVKNLQYRPYSHSGMNYDDTRILIVPSKAESWSLCATEAMARGIPVICSHLPGLRENCGDAAIYASTIKEYIDAITLLNYENVYEKFRHDVLARFALHNYNEELNLFYNFIENICNMAKQKIKVPADVNANIKKTNMKKVVTPGAAPVKEKKEFKGLPTQK